MRERFLSEKELDKLVAADECLKSVWPGFSVTVLDKVPRPSISNVIWILPSDTDTDTDTDTHYLSAQPIIFK